MEGIARAAKRKHDSDIFSAWHVAAFSGAAQAGKLKPLSKYLEPISRPKPQTGAEMLEVLRQFKEMGAPMTITQVN